MHTANTKAIILFHTYTHIIYLVKCAVLIIKNYKNLKLY